LTVVAFTRLSPTIYLTTKQQNSNNPKESPLHKYSCNTKIPQQHTGNSSSSKKTKWLTGPMILKKQNTIIYNNFTG